MPEMESLDAVSRARAHVRQFERRFEESRDSWPEVPRGFWLQSGEPPVDPMNSERRVVFEMILVLASTAAIAVAIAVFSGGLPAV
ncbi:MAG TPA: hypothetical protein VMF58_09655 [Rhizomicrobium sp.]|nr:hypothetical protein [Rhizomicrobium sp.]